MKCRSPAGTPSSYDRISPIHEQSIRQDLIDRGLLGARDSDEIEALAGGLNNRVFLVRRPGEEPRFIVRLRRPDDRSTAEVDALSDVAGCPGVPKLHLLTGQLIVLDYLSGEPRDLEVIASEQLATLVERISCVHANEYERYSLWPALELQAGSRADLFRFRCASLANYESYDRAKAGAVHPALPDLLGLLERRDLASSSWNDHLFSRLHGDLSRGNILWADAGPGLIDWEYSRIGDPAEELAYLLSEQPGGVDRYRHVVGLYIDAGGDTEIAGRIPAYGLFTAIDSALWWADYAQSHASDAENQIAGRIAAARSWLSL